MTFIDSSRAGKRVCVWLDSSGKCVRARPAPPQETHSAVIELTSGGQTMPAGKAVKLGYLTYDEVKSMYPLIEQGATQQAQGRSRKTKIKVRKETTRWGVTKCDWPLWTPLDDRGKMRDDYRNYQRVEERVVTLEVATDGEDEHIIAILGFTTQPYERRGQ